MRVLITWGSTRHGTEGIAKIIGDELRNAGHEVVLSSAKYATWSTGFGAVIIGGALYANRWHRHAKRFLVRNESHLRDLPVWMYSSGPLDDSASSDPIAPTREVRALMDRIGAQGHATFGGRLEADARGMIASAMAKKRSGDFRDPKAIRAWAADIARALPTAEPFGKIATPGSSWLSIASRALVGWAACAGATAMAPTSLALLVNAIAAPIVFAVIARQYFRLRGAREPLVTATTMAAFVALFQLILAFRISHGSAQIVANLIDRSPGVALLFLVTWAIGAAKLMAPDAKGEVASGSILVVVGHPSHDSFSAALAEAYREGAGAAAEIVYVGDLAFDPSLHEGYRREMPVEPDLARVQQQIRTARHLAFFYPQWWGAMPAIPKGFVDRVFLPGFAFRNHPKDPFADGLLAGRSADVWLTSDAPRLWYFLKYWNAPVRAMKTATLEFCGIKPVAVTAVDRVRYLSPRQRRAWIYRARMAGEDAVLKLAVNVSRPMAVAAGASIPPRSDALPRPEAHAK